MSLFDFAPPQDFADHAIRHTLSDPRNLREVVVGALPAEIASRLDFDKAQYLGPEFLLEDWRGREADILVLIPYQDPANDSSEPVLVCVLLEHQSKSDPLMPLRVLLYAVLFWDRQWKEYAAKHEAGAPLKRTPVIPVVFHTGQRPWGSNTALSDLLAGPEVLKVFAPRWDLLFWDLALKGPEELLAADGPFTRFLAVVRAEHAERVEFRQALEGCAARLEPLYRSDRMRWREYLRLVLSWAIQRRPDAEREGLTAAVVASQEGVRALREVKHMASTVKETWAEKNYREAYAAALEVARDEVRKEVREQLTKSTRLVTLREALRDLLSAHGTPSPALAAAIEACEDDARLKAAILRAGRLVTLDDTFVL